MKDQIMIEVLKTIRSLAHSKNSCMPSLIEICGMAIRRALAEENLVKARLVSYGNFKIGIIKIIREWTGMSLKDAKDFVESAPVDLNFSLDSNKLHKLIHSLEMAGAVVETAVEKSY